MCVNPVTYDPNQVLVLETRSEVAANSEGRGWVADFSRLLLFPLLSSLSFLVSGLPGCNRRALRGRRPDFGLTESRAQLTVNQKTASKNPGWRVISSDSAIHAHPPQSAWRNCRHGSESIIKSFPFFKKKNVEKGERKEAKQNTRSGSPFRGCRRYRTRCRCMESLVACFSGPSRTAAAVGFWQQQFSVSAQEDGIDWECSPLSCIAAFVLVRIQLFALRSLRRGTENTVDHSEGKTRQKGRCVDRRATTRHGRQRL